MRLKWLFSAAFFLSTTRQIQQGIVDVSPEQIDVKYLGLVAWRYQGYLKALGLAMVGECGEQGHFTDT